MRRRVESGANARPWKGASRSFESRWESEIGSAKTCMNALEFLDTNVLVYSYDIADRRKQKVAQNLVRRALAGDIVTSTQVLSEFAATLLHKVVPRVDPVELTSVLDALGPIPVVATDADMV